MTTNMNRAPNSKSSAFTKERIAAALATAPDKVIDSEAPYDPNDAAAVKAFWAKGKVRLPGERGPQEVP